MEIFGKTAIFRAVMAGLRKYCTGGYGQIGVYRVNNYDYNDVSTDFLPFFSWALPVHCTVWGHYVRGLYLFRGSGVEAVVGGCPLKV